VFAGSDIERGEFLGNYFGEIIRESEAEKRGLVRSIEIH
jgi:SET domain-containing protein